MNTRTPIEVSTRYATTVVSMPDAWAFVMDCLDKVGPTPAVRIVPVWCICDDATEQYFEVVVEGMVEQPHSHAEQSS